MNNNSKKNKTKIIIIIMCVMALIIITTGISLAIFKKEKQSSEPPTKEDEVTYLDEEEGNKINQLIIYANEIYDNEKYLDLPKSSSGYYITMLQLKEKGYDVSELVTNCTENDIIIFFDPEHKENYQGKPISITSNCSNIKQK